MQDHMATSISVRGRFFWKGDERFLVKGVVYRVHDQHAGDPLADARIADLERDVTLFKDLGLNLLFVDHIDPTCNHDLSMKLLAEAGIFVLISLPTAASTTNGAGTTTMFRAYSPELLEDCFATIDCMSQYANTLGLVVANGALSTIYSTAAAPMIKTVIRDVKKYMTTARESVGQRRLPVGYSASNSRLILKSTFDYFTSGHTEEAVDFFCYANFNWCGESTMQSSGYDAEMKSFSSTKVPVFFSQYGCNLGACGSRLFQETAAIYSSAMTSVFSGGIAYEFYDSPDIQSSHWGYGLVRAEDTAVGHGLTKLPDYHNLKWRLEACEKTLSEQCWAKGSTDAADDKSVELLDTPPLSHHWKAGLALPYSLADWSSVRSKLDEKLWVNIEIEQVEDIRLDTAPRLVRA